MRTYIFYLAIFSFLISCGIIGSKQLELQEFSPIEVKDFKKKNVAIASTLRFYNANEKSVSIVYAEFDVLVNGNDVGTFIQNKSKDIAGSAIYELPISLSFEPEDAFSNLDYGVVKIKSDVVCDVKLVGFLTCLVDGKEKKYDYKVVQKVLFSNNGKLYLDENGNLKEK